MRGIIPTKNSNNYLYFFHLEVAIHIFWGLVKSKEKYVCNRKCNDSPQENKEDKRISESFEYISYQQSHSKYNKVVAKYQSPKLI